MASPTQTWQEISVSAKQKLEDSIPPEWRIPSEKLPSDDVLDVTSFPAESGLLTPQELEITESLATEIISKIAKGNWNAEQVLIAFCKRASIAHQLTNCLTVTMFPSALARARALDTSFAQTNQPTGPLHGLPISLKDNFNIPGVPSSVGFTAWALAPSPDQSTIVTTLLALGAIPYVKTNVPTAMMIAESVNHVYGRTANPLNRHTTSGGSSGGESALIALRGSPLGVGTDIGGSLRIPAACTGIFTIRPSCGRFPHFDARSGLAGQEAVGSVHGPMARSVADLRLFAKTVVDSEPWRKDPKCFPIPWRSVDLPATLRIGVLWENGSVRPSPAVTRALRETIEALKRKGRYEFVEWPSTDHEELAEILAKLFIADGGTSVRKILESTGEPFRPEMEGYRVAEEMGVYELWQLQKRRTALAKRYLDRMEAAGVDAILGPVTPYAGAPKAGTFRHVGYTGVFNVLDYSSVSFPTGVVVDKAVDGKGMEEEARNEVERLTMEEFDVEVSHGLPVSLQLTGKKLEEEKILAVAERVAGDLM